MRGLIKPPPGHGVAYIDWSQQEFGIAAVLSGDSAMQAAYLSGDPYLAFAKQAGAVPADATKQTHGPTRELFKQCVLGGAIRHGSRGLGAADRSAADRRARPVAGAPRDLPRLLALVDAAVDHAMLTGSLHTVFGWHVHVGEDAKPAVAAQFPDAGQRRGNAASGLLPGDRARDRGLRAGA